MLGEAFTVLAVLEAVDKISGPLEKMNGVLDQFSETTVKAAETATEAGAKIDEALLRTASGADAVEIADARLSVAQSRLTQATEQQAEAEQALLDIQARAAAGLEDEVAATDQMATAADALTAAQKRTAAASKAVTDAQQLQADTARAAAAAQTEAAGETDVAAGAQAKLGAAADETSSKSGLMSKAMGVGALAIAAIGYESVKAAGNWQSLTEHLVTDAGESQKNLAMVSAGMLKLAADTGTSTTDVANGMYHVESAGFHGAQALQVLTAATEGAKVGGADLDTVSKALTGTMNAYSMSGSQATSMMNQLITAVGQGDMKMQDLASSLGNVAPVAAAAHISFAQVAGAIATMTAQNMSAQQATQDLSHTISSLQNPNAVQIKQMQALGLNSNQVSNSLGKVGLTGTLDELTQAVAKNTTGGQVLISTFNQSKQAAANAQTMINAMPASLQSVAKAYLAGSITSKQWTTDLQGMSPVQAAMMKQFAGVADQTHKFNQLLTSGSPAAETYNAAMSKLLGGTTGLKTALMLTGGRAATFQSAVDAVGKATDKTGSSVDNWAAIQGTFNQKLDRLKSSTEAAGISIGTALLPVVSKIASAVLDVVTPIANWITKHQTLTTVILGSLGGIMAFAGAVAGVSKAVKLVSSSFDAVKSGFETVSKVAGTVSDTVGKIPWSDMASGAQSAMSTVTDGLQAVATGTKAAATATLDFSRSLLTAAASGLRAAGAWALEKVQILASAVAEKTAAAAQWLLDAAMDASPIGLIITALVALAAGFAYLWTHSAAFRDFWISAWHDIEGAAQTVWSWLQDAFHGIMAAVDAVVGFVRSHWPLLLAILTGPIGIAVALVVKYWGDIKQYFSDGVHAVLAAVDWLGQIPGKVWGFLVAMNAKIAQALAAAVAWFAGLPGRIMGWLEQLGADAIGIGSNIISGIVSGVENAAGSLFSSLENVAKGALNAAKSFLGISSPSRQFAEQVGKWIPHGIAQGIDQYASVAHAAVSRLSAGLTTTAHATVTGSFTGSGIPAVAGSGGGVTIINQFDFKGAVVSNNAAMNQLAQQVGNAIAKKLPGAGVKTRTI